MNTLKYVLLFTVLSAVQCVYATNVRFVGAGKYQINGSTVRINFDKLENVDSSYISGSLYLQLWASPDDDPTGAGFELTDAVSLSEFNGAGDDTLAPGASFTNISFTTRYNAPPSGRYYVFLLIFEYPDLDSYLDSVPAMNNPATLGNGNQGNPNPNPNSTNTGSSKLEMECPCTYVVNGESGAVSVARIINGLDGGRSGSLKLKLWATENDYVGGNIQGYVLGEVGFNPLVGGAFYTDIQGNFNVQSPPRGNYYVILTLTEFRDGRDYIVDYVSLERTLTVSDVIQNRGLGDGGGDSGGSGGSFIWLDVMLLLSAWFFRKKVLFNDVG